MSRVVQYERFGGPEVLSLVEVPPPRAGSGQVRVRVQIAGLNPFDWKVFTDAGGHASRSALPSGVGADFAGVIDEVGESVSGWEAGDEVFGSVGQRAQADFIVIDADATLHRKPAALAPEAAGSLAVAGSTAAASVASLGLTRDDTVLVSAAAGGVGVLSAQLARLTGATVIGTASEDNHSFLRELGVIPVAYGDGLAERVRALAPRSVTAALDNHGRDTIAVAVALGVPQSRINTIAYHGDEFPGVGHAGSAQAAPDDIVRLAALIAGGDIVLPIDSVFPLERVSDAYSRLMAGHVRGKIVLALT